jgi:hypothetical protein
MVVLLAGMCQLNEALSTVVPKLNQNIRPLQRIALLGNGLRLLLIVGLVLIFPHPVLFLVANLVGALVLARLSQRLNRKYLAPGLAATAVEIKEVWRRTYPHMSRSGRVKSAVGIVRNRSLDNLDHHRAAIRSARRSQSIDVAVRADGRPSDGSVRSSISIRYDVSRFTPTDIGPIICWLGWHLNASRGWVQGSWITIPITVVTQVTFGLMVDLSTVRGAIMLGSLPVIPTAVYLLLTGLQHLKRTRELQTIVG